MLLNSFSEKRIITLDQKISIVRRFKIINSIIQDIHKVILTTKFDKNKKMLEFIFSEIKKLISKYEDTS